MKSILLFLCFIACSYCIKTTRVYKNSRTSLPTTNLQEKKYFYLVNSDYSNSYSGYIYICLEDKNFGLSYDNIKYCFENYDPLLYPNAATYYCNYSTISYYSYQSTSDTTKYYYKIFANTSISIYTIVKYEGSYSNGYLNVTADVNDFVKITQMIQVNRNSRTSLPTTISDDNYFYLTNSDYSSHSTSIYICLEDNNFGLQDNKIKYCLTNKDPDTNRDTIIKECYFMSTTYFRRTQSDPTKYYYEIATINYYSYSIVKYEGIYASGKLYVTSDYNNLAPNVKMTQIYSNSTTSLPATSLDEKFVYLTNSDYYSYSNYIYICFEDDNFGLIDNNIKYCRTNINPSSNPDNVIKDCYFSKLVSYFKTQSSSGTTKYYYKIMLTASSYTYSIVFYEGSYSSGYIYVTSDYKDLVKTVKMTKVYRDSRTYLETSSLYDKYFFLRNNDYYSYSNYLNSIYICSEDDNFGLKYNNIKYCLTNKDPSSNPSNVVSGCSFSKISYYKSRSSSGTNKYYYMISISSSSGYSIVSYEGSSSGNLYVTSDYNNLFKNVNITQVYRNSKTSLPTISSDDKYFCLTNKDYYSYSNYIYICLEDNNFGLSYNNLEYCTTNTDPYLYPDNAVNNCLFSSLHYDSTQSTSGKTKYYFKIPTSGSYSYSIINYEGSSSSGNLYVTSDYESISNDDNKGISSGAIIGIVVGSIAALLTFIIIICYCRSSCKKNKIDFIPVTQPYYPDPNPSNQTNMLLPLDIPNVQLQPINVINEAD